MEILEPPYQSDLGTSGMNPLLELGIRRRPIEDAWGFTLGNKMALHVGAHEDLWILARPERSLLVLGPPRNTGKTTSVLVPIVIVAFAPVVAASTKDDVFAASAQTRALMGRLWHFAPDGTEPTPDGARKLRWSPVPAAADWDMAVTTAEVMVSVANAPRRALRRRRVLVHPGRRAARSPTARRGPRRPGHAHRHALGDAAGPVRSRPDPRAPPRPLPRHPHRLGSPRRSGPHRQERAVRLLGARPTPRWRRIGGRRRWRSPTTRTSIRRPSCSAPGAPPTLGCRATTPSTSTPPD